MSRNATGGYGHSVKELSSDCYRVYDRKFIGNRLRFPRHIQRDTDFAGAVRFVKKWGVVLNLPAAVAAKLIEG